MLTISPCLDRDTVSVYCKKCKRLYSAAFYAYLAENGGELLAAALFEVLADQVRVVWYETVEPSDRFLFDGVLRAGIHYAAQQGIETGYIPEAFHLAHRSLFSQLNYPVQTAFNITNFFQKYKSCGGL